MRQGELELAVGPTGTIHGDLEVPDGAGGVVLFAHGSGSSRGSPRNQEVAAHLRRQGLGTLLFDLLTQREELADRDTGHLRFDIGLLAERVELAVAAVVDDPATRALPIGLFGASTGAAAAVVAAARDPAPIAALVARGGRPDLAGDALESVQAPTLLIVGERDRQVRALNEAAGARLRCHHQLVVVPRATHLFEEPGALEEVARLAGEWFTSSFAARAGAGGSGPR
jgi:putative phosphoribosyl transferase